MLVIRDSFGLCCRLLWTHTEHNQTIIDSAYCVNSQIIDSFSCVPKHYDTSKSPQGPFHNHKKHNQNKASLEMILLLWWSSFSLWVFRLVLRFAMKSHKSHSKQKMKWYNCVFALWFINIFKDFVKKSHTHSKQIFIWNECKSVIWVFLVI